MKLELQKNRNSFLKMLKKSSKHLVFFSFTAFIVLFTQNTKAQTVLVNETAVVSDTYTVLSNGLVEITIIGGEGGEGTNTTGGEGATVSAKFNVSTNDVIRYLIAEGGFGGSQAGGAGSTGVYINNTLVMVAGGGGGGDNSTGAIGLGANNIENGDTGTSTNNTEGLGGTSGNGGQSNNRSGAGGGILTNGQDGTQATGGSASDTVNYNLANGGSGTGNGGRGLTGGGAGANSYSGAGAGYSGGGGAGANGSAGGGGSFINISFTGYDSHTISAGSDGATSGGSQQNGNNGSIIISSFKDTDGDSILDDVDVDDDNDGILDVNECPDTTKVVFNYTGSDQLYTIPSNATSVTAKIWGAGGRGDIRNGRGVGGAGGYSEITMNINDFTTNNIIITVGEGGNSSTGSSTYGNGGAGLFSNSRNYGAGGGMSAISYVTLSNPSSVSQADLLAIAGGGGTMPAFSNSNTNAGEGGGLSGGDATDNRAAINGLGGSQSVGGGSTNGNVGGFLFGGNAIQNGGAGGGGYYGGGSGSFSGNEEGGGGGGSGYVTSLAISSQTLRGSVRIPPMQGDIDYISDAGVGGNNNGQNGGNGLIILIINYNCDVDGDGINNDLDTDSDNDGCPDAIEGAGNIQASQLITLTGGSIGGSSNNLGKISDSEGNPLVNSLGFEQLSTAAAVNSNNNEACLIDLSLTKNVNKSIPTVGDEVIFTIILKNSGLADATGLQVKDILPTGLSYVIANSTIPSNTTYNPVSGIWDLSNLSIINGQTIELKIAATVNTAETIITNKAEVFTVNETDKDSIPNSDN